MTYQDIVDLLGENADDLLNHVCEKLPKGKIHHTGCQHVQQVFKDSDRSKTVQQNLSKLYNHGRLGKTGYLSILPVDQGIEHTAGFSFAANPEYFDPQRIVELAIEGECNGVASTVGVLGLVSKRYAHRIPFVVKLNHNELLTYPNTHNQVLFAQVKQAYEMGAVGVGATIYYGSPESKEHITEISEAFYQAHQLGMFTILWCYPRNKDWQGTTDYESAADITGQANHLGVTIEADIIKQKFPTAARGFESLSFAKHSPEQYEQLLTDHPIDLVRYQVMNCYAGKIGMLNSGGESQGEEDLTEAIRQAVINKRGGGSGLIMGRKVFKRPFDKGVSLLHAVQDVYLEQQITLA
jgi:fructose-bisphosphate aldolase, class I